MEKSIDSVRRNFGTVRTGRANTSILDRIMARVCACATLLTRTCRLTWQRAFGDVAGGLLRRADAAEEHGEREHAGRAVNRHPAL
jgi:hypothetical protein